LACEEFAREEEDVDLTRGPMISRFSFTIDVREWGFSDPRSELVRLARTKPEIRSIAESDVWDERGEAPREEGSVADATQNAGPARRAV
jgi:hypothetical protein